MSPHERQVELRLACIRLEKSCQCPRIDAAGLMNGPLLGIKTRTMPLWHGFVSVTGGCLSFFVRDILIVTLLLRSYIR